MKLVWLAISAVALAAVVLLSADFITLEVTQGLLDSGTWKGTLAIALVALAGVCMLAAAILLFRTIGEDLWRRLLEIDQNLRRDSLSFSRILSFGLFMAVAGVTSYFAWKHLSQDNPDSKVVIGLLTATLVALLFALSGRDLVRRLQKVGTAGIEFGLWQEIARIADTNYLDEDRLHLSSTTLEGGELSHKQRWLYERAMSHYLHLKHSGVDIHELEGADLRSYRRLILWLGKRTLHTGRFQKALDILRPVDHLRDVTHEEMFLLALAHWYLAIELDRSRDSEGTAIENDQDSVFHHMEARRLLERVITSPNREALAHFALGYVYDELREYNRAIEQNLIAVKMDPLRFHTWGYWTMAVSHLKSGDPKSAVEALEQIKSDDDDWQEIWEDEELADLRNHPEHGTAFAKLCGKGFWERLKAALSW